MAANTLELFPTPEGQRKRGNVDDVTRPLADRLRPQTLEEVLGQDAALAEGSMLAQAISTGRLPSVIFWGPPGCGKTTIARLLADAVGAHFISVSAITSGTADLKRIFDDAAKLREAGTRTVLMVDEIHRFNRAQQDVFLPFVEDGTVVLIGATTENPSFELNAALLSRCKVVVLHRLPQEALEGLITRAEEDAGRPLPLTEEARATLAALADGDGRYLLGLCEELLALQVAGPMDGEALLAQVRRRMPVYDKSRDGHYNLISALHKSLRGSDPDAGLYWLYRMLDGGDDPLYITRRLVRFASEDVGMADPQALTQALAAKDAYDFLGSPEGELAIAQAVVYLATAPKSNALYKASKFAMKDAKESGSLTPPKHILNAPTKLMKEEGYGGGYQYDHDTKERFSGQEYFPEEMTHQYYYRPVGRGFERDIAKRLEYWQSLRAKKQSRTDR